MHGVQWKHTHTHTYWAVLQHCLRSKGVNIEKMGFSQKKLLYIHDMYLYVLGGGEVKERTRG